MLDSLLWKVFEKTGNIDAYLLYLDIKNINSTGNDESREKNNNEVLQIN